jgi:hypothetical protein
MGNQQLLTNTELAWLAGFWDADGTISLSKQNERGRWSFGPRVGVYSSDTGTITRIREMLDTLGVNHGISETGVPMNKQVWCIYVNNLTNALKLLTALLPYLYTKRFQAERMVEFCEARLKVKKSGNKSRHYTVADFERVLAILEANGDKHSNSETVRAALEEVKRQSALTGNR